jgi:hypothetical protein
MMVPDIDGVGGKRIDVEKVIQAAIALGKQPSTSWRKDEEDEIQPHPLQTPPRSN